MKTDLKKLAAEVAVEVMEWHQVQLAESCWYWADREGKQVADVYWSPSTDWSAAGEVLKHCAAQGRKPILWYDSDRLWKANLGYEEHGARVMSEAKSPKVAICLAALAGVRFTATS